MDTDRRRRGLDKVARLSSRAGDLTTLWSGVTEVLADTVPFYWTPCYYTLDPASLLITSHFHEGLAEFPAEWLQHEYDGRDVHSLAEVVASPTGVSTLHGVTGGDPSHTRRWQQNMELGGDQEMIARLQTRSGETWGAVGLYREPDRPLFDEQDQAFLGSLSATLAEGVRRSLLLGEASDPQWPDAPGLLILGPDLTVESSSPGAERWLEELEGTGPGHLPPVVRSVATAAAEAAGASLARAMSRRGAWVVLHGAPLRGEDPHRVAVILESANPDRLLPLLMSVYGLTERERQVVGLVLRGLATGQIASRLFVSTNTVQQHLTSIFEKVGVRSRGELTARLFFTHYEPRVRDNEQRTSTARPVRGGPWR
ncbi:LuxR C-terminal-related transcriptional regulator [Nocardioides sp. GCM10027113]|uniref:helix-turn-helix transcriptional regulator n=1 Tax=unclassified Nocardioides TaxID=2615069 RepID=UPI00360AEB5F